jgi:hypothetical protein
MNNFLSKRFLVAITVSTAVTVIGYMILSDYLANFGYKYPIFKILFYWSVVEPVIFWISYNKTFHQNKLRKNGLLLFFICSFLEFIGSVSISLFFIINLQITNYLMQFLLIFVLLLPIHAVLRYLVLKFTMPNTIKSSE